MIVFDQNQVTRSETEEFWKANLHFQTIWGDLCRSILYVIVPPCRNSDSIILASGDLECLNDITLLILLGFVRSTGWVRWYDISNIFLKWVYFLYVYEQDILWILNDDALRWCGEAIEDSFCVNRRRFQLIRSYIFQDLQHFRGTNPWAPLQFTKATHNHRLAMKKGKYIRNHNVSN